MSIIGLSAVGVHIACEDEPLASDIKLVAKSVTLREMVEKVGKNYKFVPVEANQGVVHWTDDYSNLFKVLKF